MSARIAPEPVAQSSISIGNYSSRVRNDATGDLKLPPTSVPATPAVSTSLQTGTRYNDNAPPELPALPPGAMFAAAVAAGALSPVPETSLELALRIGQNWSLPSPEQRLTDKLA
ncbi:MAG: hypothetical protein JWR75_67 [Devosia sp.]|nr:hypothetical protein [Devosia sp.]